MSDASVDSAVLLLSLYVKAGWRKMIEGLTRVIEKIVDCWRRIEPGSTARESQSDPLDRDSPLIDSPSGSGASSITKGRFESSTRGESRSERDAAVREDRRSTGSARGRSIKRLLVAKENAWVSGRARGQVCTGVTDDKNYCHDQLGKGWRIGQLRGSQQFFAAIIFRATGNSVSVRAIFFTGDVFRRAI